MLLAIVSSTIPATYMISSRYQSALKFIPALKTDNSRNIVAAILFMVICTLIGALGLTNLANTGLTIVSYIGMPLVVIPLFFIWPQRTQIPSGGARTGCRRADILTFTPPMPVSVCRAGTDKNPRHPFTPSFNRHTRPYSSRIRHPSRRTFLERVTPARTQLQKSRRHTLRLFPFSHSH